MNTNTAVRTQNYASPQIFRFPYTGKYRSILSTSVNTVQLGQARLFTKCRSWSLHTPNTSVEGAVKLPHKHTMKAYDTMEAYRHAFLISALVRGGRLHAPSVLPPEERLHITN
jgi:hypothetical protein